MKIRLICLALASSFASGAAYADSHRLAFSKSAQIEIFVEHATGTPWCTPQLDMRVVYQGEHNPAAFADLMPKIGALLGQQCPEARAVTWKAQSAAGTPLGQGTSAKTANWMLATTPEAVSPAEASVVAEVSTAVPSVPVSSAPAPSAVAPPVAETPSSVASAAATPSAGTRAAEAVPAKAPEPVASAQPEVPASVVPAQVRSTPEPVAAPAQTAEPKQVAAAPAPVVLPADFTVNGWAPQTYQEVRAQAKFLTSMQDQNGCTVISRFDLGDTPQYVSLKSEQLTCGADGMASGSGRLILERSDGAVLARTSKVWFSSGIPFSQEISQAHLGATDGERTLWLVLGHDTTSQSFYMLRATVPSPGFNRIGVLQIDPRIDILTNDVEAFRQAEPIQAAVSRALTALQNTAMPGASSGRLVFANDFKNGLAREDSNHYLYEIRASRRSDWRTGRGQGDWQFDLRQATNHVFQREQRLAEEKRRKEQQQAREQRAKLAEAAYREQRKLSAYETLVRSPAKPQAVLASLQKDVSYTPLEGGGYSRMVRGQKAAITRVVRVNGNDGDDAKVDWPYDMRLIGQKSAKNQWYLISGQATVDTKRRDSEGLPLTLVTVNAQGMLPCAQEGCLDMADPLTRARLQFDEPEWTPELAQKIIDQANQP